MKISEYVFEMSFSLWEVEMPTPKFDREESFVKFEFTFPVPMLGGVLYQLRELGKRDELQLFV